MAASKAPAGLGPRGRRLWREVGADEDSPTRRLLVEEACRLADRLDRLDALLSGKSSAWLTLAEKSGTELTVVVDKVLSEARLHAVSLKLLIAELRQGAAGSAGAAISEGGTADELANRRARRIADASG
jgi:hypothetical protein